MPDEDVRETDEGDADHQPAASAPEPKSTLSIGWLRATLTGVGVFVYFAVFTVWFPSKMLRLDSVASADQWVQDSVATLSWSVPLVIGLFGLRIAQSRRLI